MNSSPFETQSLLRDTDDNVTQPTNSASNTIVTPETRTGINIRNGVIPMKNSIRNMMEHDTKLQKVCEVFLLKMKRLIFGYINI